MQTSGEDDGSGGEPLDLPAYDGRNPDSPPPGSMWYRTDLETVVGKLDNEIVDVLTGTTIGADYSDGGTFGSDDDEEEDEGEDADDGGGWLRPGDDGEGDEGEDEGESESGGEGDGGFFW